MPSFQPEQLSRITDERLDRAEAAYTVIVALVQKVAASELWARPAESTS